MIGLLRGCRRLRIPPTSLTRRAERTVTASGMNLCHSWGRSSRSAPISRMRRGIAVCGSKPNACTATSSQQSAGPILKVPDPGSARCWSPSTTRTAVLFVPAGLAARLTMRSLDDFGASFNLLPRPDMPLEVPAPRTSRFGSPLVLSRVHWVRPVLVAEVTYLTWTGENLL